MSGFTIALITAGAVIVVVAVMLALRARSRRRLSTLDARTDREPASPPTGAAGVSPLPLREGQLRVTTDAPLRDRAAREGRPYRPGMYDRRGDTTEPTDLTGYPSIVPGYYRGEPAAEPTAERAGHASHHDHGHGWNSGASATGDSGGSHHSHDSGSYGGHSSSHDSGGYSGGGDSGGYSGGGDSGGSY